jgi:hypothetical protein
MTEDRQMPTPLDVVLSGVELEIAGRIQEGAFYQCRDGSIVGPMIDDGREISFGYAAALGGYRGEEWLIAAPTDPPVPPVHDPEQRQADNVGEHYQDKADQGDEHGIPQTKKGPPLPKERRAVNRALGGIARD